MSNLARKLPALLLTATLGVLPPACSSIPGMQDPTVTLSPRYYVYELTGAARMQSASGGTVVENAPVDTSRLGQNGHDDDLGAVIAIGDGFSGFDFEYQKISISDTSTGVLTSDFGRLQTGTVVNSSFEQDEFRLGYVAEVLDHEFEIDEDDYLRLRFGPGGTLVHREGSFDVGEDANNEQLEFADDVTPYLSIRTRVEWRDASLQLDWDYNPDISFGGDFQGDLHDVELLGRYTMEAQAVTFVVGYRWSDVQFSSSSRGLRYDADLRVQGYVLGLEFGF